MGIFGLGKTKAVKCSDCGGTGIILVVSGQYTGNSVEVTPTAYTLCARCRGIGFTGVKEVQALDAVQLAKIAKGRPRDELLNLFNGKTQKQVQDLISSLLEHGKIE